MHNFQQYVIAICFTQKKFVKNIMFIMRLIGILQGVIFSKIQLDMLKI